MIEEFYSFASCMSAHSAVPPGDEGLTVFFTVPDFNNIKYNYSSGISQLNCKYIHDQVTFNTGLYFKRHLQLLRSSCK